MELFILISFSFFIRLVVSLAPTSDLYAHIWTIKKAKYNGFGNHSSIKCIFSSKQGYPSFPNWIITLVPQQYSIILGYFLNILYDILGVLIVYFLTNYIISTMDSTYVPILSSFSHGFLVALLYSVTPVLLPITARLKSIGGRTFGNLIVFPYFISVYFLLSEDFSFIVSFFFIVSLSLVLISSQFALQVVLSFTTVIAIYYMNINIMILLLSFIGFSYLVNFLGIRDILVGKLNHWAWYFKSQEKGTTASGRNNISDIIKLPYYLLRDREMFLKIVFLKSTILILIYSVPQLFIVLYNFENIKDIIFLYPVLEYMYVIALASVIVFIFTSLKPFLFLGQAERYFEYSVFPITFFYYILCLDNNSLRWLFYIGLVNITIVFVLFIVSNYKSYYQNFKDQKSKDFIDFIDYLNTNFKKETNVVVLPTKFSFDCANYTESDNIKFYYPFVIQNDTVDGFKYMQEDEEELYYLHADFQKIKKKYNTNLVVLYKKSMKTMWYDKYIKALQNYNCIYENSEYIIYKLDND